MNKISPKLLIDIIETYKKESHCFKFGSSKKTILHWIYKTTGNRYKRSELGLHLDYLIELEFFITSKNHSGFTCYIRTE